MITSVKAQESRRTPYERILNNATNMWKWGMSAVFQRAPYFRHIKPQ